MPYAPCPLGSVQVLTDTRNPLALTLGWGFDPEQVRHSGRHVNRADFCASRARRHPTANCKKDRPHVGAARIVTMHSDLGLGIP